MRYGLGLGTGFQETLDIPEPVLLYPETENAIFFVNPKEHQNFYHSPDLVEFERCTDDDGNILKATVNKIVCPITGRSLVSNSDAEYLLLKKDGGGNYYLTNDSEVSWMYNLNEGNLLLSSGNQIITVASFEGLCVLNQLNGTDTVTAGCFIGRRNTNTQHGFYSRRWYTSATLSQIKCRGVNYHIANHSSFIYENTQLKTVLESSSGLANSSRFGGTAPGWNNANIYGYIIYSSVPIDSAGSIGYLRHSSVLEYYGGVGGGIIV